MGIQKSSIAIEQPYFIPSDYSVIRTGEFMIVIRPRHCRWLVLNEMEYFLLNAINTSQSLKECIRQFAKSKNIALDSSLTIAKKLLVQLEGSQFAVDSTSEIERYKHLNILLTLACNLKCRHCYINAGTETHNEWDEGKWTRIISQFAALGGEGITLTGGEPTLSPSFKGVITQARKFGLKIVVLSNGVRWNSDISQLCLNSVDELQFSLDGPNEESHEFIRGKGTYNAVLQNLHKALKAGTKVVLAMTPTEQTLPAFRQHFESMAKSLMSEYPNNLKIKISQRILPGRDPSVSGSISTQEYLAEGRMLLDQVYGNYAQQAFFLDHPMGLLHRNCGYSEMTIAPDGFVFPCNRIQDVGAMGNLNEHSLAEVVDIAKDVNDRTSVENISPCKKCHLQFICGGGCRIDDVYTRDDNALLVDCSKRHKEHILNMMIQTRELYAKPL